MREVLVKVSCDVCHGESGTISEAMTYLISVDGSKPREIDLCADDYETLLAPLVLYVDKYGSSPQAPPKRPHRRTRPSTGGPNSVEVLAEQAAAGQRRGQPPQHERAWSCLWCPLTYASTTGLLRHLSTVHGAEPSIQAVYGVQCPLCDGHPFQSLGAHVSRQHEHVRNVAEAFMLAAQHGDEHGVVRQVHQNVSENVLTSYESLVA